MAKVLIKSQRLISQLKESKQRRSIIGNQNTGDLSGDKEIEHFKTIDSTSCNLPRSCRREKKVSNFKDLRFTLSKNSKDFDIFNSNTSSLPKIDMKKEVKIMKLKLMHIDPIRVKNLKHYKSVNQQLFKYREVAKLVKVCLIKKFYKEFMKYQARKGAKFNRTIIIDKAFKDPRHSHLEDELYSVSVLNSRNRRISMNAGQNKIGSNLRMINWLSNSSKDTINYQPRYNIVNKKEDNQNPTIKSRNNFFIYNKTSGGKTLKEFKKKNKKCKILKFVKLRNEQL